MAACSQHCPLRHPAPSLGNWYTGLYLRIFDPGPNNPTIFLRLCSPGDYRQSIESPMGVPTFNSTEKALTFTIYDCILRIRPKNVCYLTKVSPLDVDLIQHAPSVECAVPVYRLMASKGLTEVDICHQMTSLCILYLMALTYIFKVNICKH